MQIAVIGTGGIGSGLASLFSRSGHEVIMGARDAHAAENVASAVGAARVASYAQASAAAQLICLGIPWDHAAAAIAQLGDLRGKILLDPTNPEAADGVSLAIGHVTSGAEMIAQHARGAAVVKAFNYVYAELLRDGDALARVAPTIFLCGDDASANASVSEVVRSCGLKAVDCGALKQARYLEPLAMLMVQLVRTQGWHPDRIGMRFAHAD